MYKYVIFHFCAHHAHITYIKKTHLKFSAKLALPKAPTSPVIYNDTTYTFESIFCSIKYEDICTYIFRIHKLEKKGRVCER